MLKMKRLFFRGVVMSKGEKSGLSRTPVCCCCGAVLTAPQFYKGRAYGWSCITKVSSQKRSRDSGLWIKADHVEFQQEEGFAYGTIIATVGDTKFSGRAMIANYGQDGEHIVGRSITIDGLIPVAKFANGSNHLFRNIRVVQSRSDGKLFPVSVVNERTKEVLAEY